MHLSNNLSPAQTGTVHSRPSATAGIFRKSPPTYVMRIGTPECVPGQGDRPFTRGVIEPLLHEKTAARLNRASRSCLRF